MNSFALALFSFIFQYADDFRIQWEFKLLRIERIYGNRNSMSHFFHVIILIQSFTCSMESTAEPLLF